MKPAAKKGDHVVALDTHLCQGAPPHVPPAGKSFDVPPSNRVVVVAGSGTVLANHRPMARHDDAANTCNDPVDQRVGAVVAGGNVIVGD